MRCFDYKTDRVAIPAAKRTGHWRTTTRVFCWIGMRPPPRISNFGHSSPPQSGRGILAEASKGFTILEILVVTALFTLLVGLGLFMSMETFRGTLYRSEESVIVSLLERARSRAMNNIDQSPWGVCYRAPAYVLFKGAPVSCAAAVAEDTVPSNASIAVASDFAATFPVVIFTQLSGTTSATNIPVVQDSRNSGISINHEGAIIR